MIELLKNDVHLDSIDSNFNFFKLFSILLSSEPLSSRRKSLYVPLVYSYVTTQICMR